VRGSDNASPDAALRGDRCPEHGRRAVVVAEHRGAEWEKGDRKQKQEIEPKQGSVGASDVLELEVMTGDRVAGPHSVRGSEANADRSLDVM
jgi:hypothetical protein